MVYDKGYSLERKVALTILFKNMSTEREKEYRSQLKKDDKEKYDDFVKWENKINEK